MPERPVPPHDHTRFSRGGKLSSAAITGLTTSSSGTGGGSSSGGGVSDHSSLSGLAADDHTAYVTVAYGGGETLNTVTATGASETIDLALGNVHDFTLSAGTVTLSISGATTGVADSATVLLRQDGTGGRLVSWPGAVVWPGGVTPTLGTAAAAVDVFTLFSLDGGTTWFGFQAGSGSATIDYAETGDLAAVAETAAAGSSAEIPRADHVHTIAAAAVQNAGRWEVVVSGSAPPVAVSTPSDDDWVFAWVAG